MQGIIDCTGKAIHLGDWLRAPDGRVFQVEGGLVLTAVAFNAAACTKIDKPKNHTPEPRRAGPNSDSVGANHPVTQASASDSDCVVWGS